eukprot:9970264-Ditylum_brightwellii.AAC.1
MSRWSPSLASQLPLDAMSEYAKIAIECGLTPSKLAVAFVCTRQFVADNGSIIVSATTMEQLKENLNPFLDEEKSNDLKILSDDAIEAIDKNINMY